MTQPDYTAQHRVIALQCATQLAIGGLFPSEDVAGVISHAEVLLAYLNDGVVPQE